MRFPLVAGALAFAAGLGVRVLRVPRRRRCGRPDIAEARALADVFPTLVLIAYGVSTATRALRAARSAIPASEP